MTSRHSASTGRLGDGGHGAGGPRGTGPSDGSLGAQRTTGHPRRAGPAARAGRRPGRVEAALRPPDEEERVWERLLGGGVDGAEAVCDVGG